MDATRQASAQTDGQATPLPLTPSTAATISPPLFIATSETTLLPSTAAEEPILSLDARQISLPKTSSEALEETEVVELQAFVSKQEWIEEKIGVGRMS